jgi:uncharacterized protein (TIGR03437 family)
VNGGKLNVIGGDTTLGVNSGATGQLEISGTGVVTTTTGNLTIGVSGTGYVSVASGGAFTVSGGSTTLGAQAGSSGQLQIFGASALPTTTGNLVIGAAGTGSVTVGNGVLTAGVITLGSASSGSGQLTVGGTVNYASINILHGAKPAVSVNSGGNLASIPQKTAASDSLVASAVVAGANSTWTTQNRLVVQGGGSLTILNGGAMNVTCSSCPALANYGTNWYLTDAFQVSGDSTVDVTGSGANLSVKPNSGVGPGATLTVENASTASLGNFLLKGKTTVQGMGSVLNPPSGSTATTITGISSGGVLIVQNEGAFRSDRMLLYGQNPQLVVQDVGEVVLGSLSPASDPALEVHSGGVLIQSNAAVLIQNDAVIGGGNSPAMVTVTGAALQGGMLQSESITIKPYGTLQIAGADIVSLGPASTINFVPGTPPGKIDVSHGELSIGKVSTDADLTVGWLNVFPGGTLLGGQDCPGIDPFCKLINGAGDLILDGSVDNQGGTIRLDPTTLSVTQNFQQSSGTLGLQMDGAGAGQYDQITAGGSIQITGGTVEFDFANGFAPHSGDKFNVLSASAALSVSGANFTTTGLASGFNYTTSINSGQFDLNATNSGTATTSAPAPPPTPTLTSSDSASGATELAPGSLASGYGTGLATGQPASATYIWPTAIGGTSVSIVDFDGATTQAPLLYVSSTEVDYQIPDTVALGPATVTVTAGNGTTKLGPVNVVPYAPGIFEVNTAGLSASFADCVASDGTQTTILTSQVVNGALVAVPLNLKACQETVLELWTTGLDEADASLVQATIGGKGATVLYAGPQGVYPGVDQVNVVIPQSLAGAGNVPVVVSTEGVTSNTVNVTIQ